MAADAVVCVNCGFDAVTRKRIVRRDSDPAGLEIPERESRAVKGPGPWIVLLVELVAFGVAAPLVWKRGETAALWYAGAAGAGVLGAYIALYCVASGEIDDDDVYDTDQGGGYRAKDVTGEILNVISGGDEPIGERVSYGAMRGRVIRGLMLNDEHWGYAQAVYYASLLALVAGAVIWMVSLR